MISGLLFADDFLFHECLALSVNQCNFIMPKSLGHPKTWNISTLPMLVYLLCKKQTGLA